MRPDPRARTPKRAEKACQDASFGRSSVPRFVHTVFRGRLAPIIITTTGITSGGPGPDAPMGRRVVAVAARPRGDVHVRVRGGTRSAWLRLTRPCLSLCGARCAPPLACRAIPQISRAGWFPPELPVASSCAECWSRQVLFRCWTGHDWYRARLLCLTPKCCGATLRPAGC